MAITAGLIIGMTSFAACTNSNAQKKWVGTWSTAPQLVEPHNMPPEPGLTNNTLRQVVCVSIGGDKLRLKFSNEFSKSPVTMKAVQVAVSEGASAIDKATVKELKFNGKSDVTMQPGEAIVSDPFTFDLEPRMEVAITIAFGETSPDVTGHPGSRTTSYIVAGNDVSENTDFADAVKTDHWYVINGIDVEAPQSAAAVAIIGNSITDGRGSGTNKQNRWPDILAQRLLKNEATQNVGVLNMGIGGNAVLRGGLGPTALNRFERDILNQNGVRWLIIMEGVNDLGGTRSKEAAEQVAQGLIDAYGKMIDEAHAQGIKVYGGTITPIMKSFYYKDYREVARNTVNEWIRTSGRFDAVIDFDKAIRNPEDIYSILPEAQSGDYLHPNENGYVMMGEAIDLSLFE
ncbi:SGNH/GDSL hydrolase family protein [uncultured Draconibacterium sp.]|uniref:SGNH/GDSL hydrolase family protein n=1 Tax=uncultured Draconibacterium sp. TaxID=1573823 RepID=UPI002600E2B1|nr:SGNH/GDSL hydrolase family protein [uncultured Draconibacterium sp.]